MRTENGTSGQAGATGRGAFRLLAYAVAIGFAARGLTQAVLKREQIGPDALDGLLSENGLLEWLQVGVLAFVGVALLSRRAGTLPLLMALGAFVGLARELDSFLKDTGVSGLHNMIMLALVILAGVIGWRNRREVRTDLAHFVHRPAFLMMVAGALFATLGAQTFGQRELWKVLARPDAVSMAKRLVEEGLEFMGYLWIAAGALDAVLFPHARAEPAVPRRAPVAAGAVGLAERVDRPVS